jgi:hypothetical protein
VFFSIFHDFVVSLTTAEKQLRDRTERLKRRQAREAVHSAGVPGGGGGHTHSSAVDDVYQQLQGGGQGPDAIVKHMHSRRLDVKRPGLSLAATSAMSPHHKSTLSNVTAQVQAAGAVKRR